MSLFGRLFDLQVQAVMMTAVIPQLLRLCNSTDVDSSWLLWSKEAEASLARAYLSAGGPSLSSPSSYVGRGSLSVYSMRLGGQCHDRIYHVDRSDEFDVTHFGFFLNSSLALVLRFRRSFVSVCNVLKGIKQHGFSEARVAALEHRWRAVVRLGPTGPVTSFEPWSSWIPPDLRGFYKWAMDTSALLNEFVLRVVRHRQSSRSLAWANWIREDLASRPYKWLRPEFVPPAPYLVCKPQDSPDGSGILVQPVFIDAHFRKAWMPYFRRAGHPVVTTQAFLDFVDDHLPQEPFLDLPILTGEDLYDAAMAKKSTAGDGWAWNEIKALSLSWFVGLALVLRQIEAAAQWPQGLLDAYVAMIPKAEGDSTPLGQRPLCVLPVVYRLWASVRLAHLKDWFSSWVPDSVFSAGKGVSSVDAWYATAIDIEEVLSQTRHSDFQIFVADVVKSFRLGLPAWFRKVYFSFHSDVRLRF